MTSVLRPHAEDQFADELAVLAKTDDRPRPPGWRLSPWAVTAYVLGDGGQITPKYIGPRRIVEGAVATRATDRALLLLGVTPFMARLAPSNIKPDPDRLWQGTVYGTICMGLMLMTGVSGPLLDTFFLGGDFGRREKVATKAMCQLVSHFTKLIYFGGVIDQAASLDPVLAGVAIAASMLGTTLARRILEAMTDQQFIAWSNKLITTIACYYVAHGGWLLLRTPVLAALAKGGLQ